MMKKNDNNCILDSVIGSDSVLGSDLVLGSYLVLGSDLVLIGFSLNLF